MGGGIGKPLGGSETKIKITGGLCSDSLWYLLKFLSYSLILLVLMVTEEHNLAYLKNGKRYQKCQKSDSPKHDHFTPT